MRDILSIGLCAALVLIAADGGAVDNKKTAASQVRFAGFKTVSGKNNATFKNRVAWFFGSRTFRRRLSVHRKALKKTERQKADSALDTFDQITSRRPWTRTHIPQEGMGNDKAKRVLVEAWQEVETYARDAGVELPKNVVLNAWITPPNGTKVGATTYSPTAMTWF